MFESIIKFFKKNGKEKREEISSRDTAKERLHLVLMQDRANVSADFLEMMKQEIIEVIKKYIDVDENEIDVRLTNKTNDDGTTGAPALYANIPIAGIKQDLAATPITDKASNKVEEKSETKNNAKQDVKGESEKVEGKKEENSEKEEQEIKENDTKSAENENQENDNKEEIKDNLEEKETHKEGNEKTAKAINTKAKKLKANGTEKKKETVTEKN